MSEVNQDCPFCGTTLSFDENEAGQICACPNCQEKIELTLPSARGLGGGAAAALAAAGQDAGELSTMCQSCGETLVFDAGLVGQTHPCPSCGKDVVLAAGSSIPVVQPPPSAAAELPARMKANRLLDGKPCGHCGVGIELGDDVFNCQNCGQSMHLACREDAGGCGNRQCVDFYAAAAAKPAAKAVATAPAAVGAATKECRFCGEAIQRKARKCRFCGEYQSEADRATKEKHAKASSGDDNLTGSEIVFGLLCGGIACIMGIVWVCQGKKKGWKLIGLSFISQLIGLIIRLAAEGM